MMKSSNDSKPNENVDSSTEVLVLDQPCEYCKVLELDDTRHGGIVQEVEGGKRFVQFKNPVYQDSDWEYQLSLGYRRQDTLPGLPNIAATAQTCAFCHMLRSDLISSYKHLLRRPPNDFYGSEHEKGEDRYTYRGARIVITDVNYLFDDPHYSLPKPWDDDDGDYAAPRRLSRSGCNDWLNLLIVFIVIDWGDSKKEYSLQYRITADTCDPCRPWLKIRRKPISNDFLSARSLRRLHELIGKSLSDASDSAQSTYLPTRLIDVGAKNSTKLRLIISKDDEDVGQETDPVKKRYLALSYCWGSKRESEKQLKTTADSLKQRLSQIDINEMPQTVADAVRACRALGIRYLWVDALCIIQGDYDDWARESLQMSKVYSSSFLTLCNLQGSSCSGGFLRTKSSRPTLKVNFRSKLDASISGVIHIRMQDPAVLRPKSQRHSLLGTSGRQALYHMQHSSWNTRGWTFQEALLSPRAVFFENQIFSYASGEEHVFADGFRYLGEPFLSSSRLTPDDPMRGWYGSMQDYSRRRLTYETDKFPAISALAKFFSEENPGQEYLAGLWKSDLQRGLLWTSSSKRKVQHVLEPCSQGYRLQRVSQEYIAPSWSWAGQPDPVRWIGNITSTEFEDGVFFPEYTLLHAEVVAADKSNPYGRVTSAYLELDAKLFQVPLCDDGKAKFGDIWSVSTSSRFRSLSLHLERVLLSPSDEYIAHFQLDWESGRKASAYPKGPVEQMWMVLISSLKHQRLFPYETENYLGLLLLPTGNEREFIRAGVWCYEPLRDQGNWQWEGIQSQSIRIV
ncbi:hypothetical protein MKX08_001310 [Trichoderma sp. CBMAI-0020]|nr:hypothetical protein MKX08_001310 [Trichoderma sp. CBMAI-0020]